MKPAISFTLCAWAGLACSLAAPDLERERAAVEKVAYTFVGWALDNKNAEALKASLSHGEDFFMFQPNSRSTIAGYQQFLKLIPGWMSPDFKATKTELREVKVGLSPSGDTAWFAAILEDCGEYKGRTSCWKDCRYTGVLEKREGRWVIVQAHFSLASDKVIEDYKLRQAAAAPAPAGGYLEVRGARLYYFTRGTGEPLLLLHGGLSSSEEFQGVSATLASRYRVIALDRRGHGRSADTGKPFDYSEMADETEAFMERLGLASAHVLGFSDGGVVAYRLAARYPQRVNKVVAIGANYRVEGMTWQAIAWIRDRMTPAGVTADYPQVVQEYRRLAPDPSHFESFLARTRAFWLRDPYLPAEDLQRIARPVLLVAGDRDDVRLEHLLEIRSHIRGAQLLVLPDTSHFVLAERAEMLTAAVLRFLGS